jgi:hypothetical protein
MDDAQDERRQDGDGFRFVESWQVENGADADDLVGFWLREGAIPDEARARERVSQVVLHVRAPDGDIAAVCTAYLVRVPRLRQSMYYYRSFVGARWRHTRLVLRTFKAAFDILERYAKVHDFPAIGVMAELENPRFANTSGTDRPVWPGGLVYIGKSDRGLDLRVRYFDGARLRRD